MKAQRFWENAPSAVLVESFAPIARPDQGSYLHGIGAHLAARRGELASAAKRGVDLAGSAVLLLSLLPLIAVTALLVMIVSPGRPLYSQVREGVGGKPIRIWKIRSMVPDADALLRQHLETNEDAAQEYRSTLKLRDDPRIIPGVGAFIRKSSIDELPQLWSVLVGDMSLVGPRVMPDVEVEQYSERGQQIRRSVRPGITGLWQVLYRNNSELRVRENADCFYVRNWSMKLDFWIALRTFVVVFSRKGAY